ncbi:MAG: peptidase M10 [Myxococcaceae bacterium]|nr:peptidase M10 [Myxococcaceae bacterium]
MTRTVLVALVMTGCGVNEARLDGAEDVTTASGTRISYEDFKARFAKWDADRGVYVADGDTVFVGEKQLREFYDLNVQEGQLIVNRVGSTDDLWDATRRQNLSYCVSDDFGTRKATVVSSMQAAAQSWMAVANVKFVYVAAQDTNCTRSNGSVVFNVRPINANGSYLAAAFFPSNARTYRELVIDPSLFAGGVSVTGVLRHELGHVLGFRHEHTRPEAGTCFEDNAWRAVTAYDSNSVMHYPQCNGTNTWQLPLTQLDIQGVQALYGAPATNPTPTPTPAPNPGATVRNFQDTVAASANKTFGPFAVQPGTAFRATMTGSGDADLYVRFGTAPTASAYDCRPYLGDSNEECRLTTPSAQSSAYITVVGYSAATFTLQVEYVAGGTGAPAPSPTGTPTTGTVSGTVAKGAQFTVNPVTVVPGTRFVVTMTGTGDPDLYVRFGSAPTLTAFDCRPYANGASETCTLTVPAGKTQAFLMVHGYAASSFTLNLQYTRP